MSTQISLTPEEEALLVRLPGPPVAGSVSPNYILVIEWLPEGDRRTGEELYAWLNGKRPGWATYRQCESKAEVIKAIEEATAKSRQTGMVPLLHLEAHGGASGLEGPDGDGNARVLLPWTDLTEPLQQLNEATGCHLVVNVAACTGYGIVQALVRGPRAPAVAIVGPDKEIHESKLFEGCKEFYRRLMDADASLTRMADGASSEAASAVFEIEAFVVFAFEAMASQLIVILRSSAVDREHVIHLYQSMWDEMFMFDIQPRNRDRFGVNIRTLVSLIDESKKDAGAKI